jgi:CP family cyanate transporter-like MFS transporter
MHDATGGWTVPLLFLVATSLVAIVPAFLLRRPTFVEDEL